VVVDLFRHTTVHRRAGVAARVALDLSDFHGGLGGPSWSVAWGLDLNKGGGPRVPLAPRRRSTQYMFSLIWPECRVPEGSTDELPSALVMVILVFAAMRNLLSVSGFVAAVCKWG
jgi:hypothetical protein